MCQTDSSPNPSSPLRSSASASAPSAFGLSSRAADVRLRPTVVAEMRPLYDLQLDEGARLMAGVKPRDWETFRTRWEVVLRDPKVTMRSIVVDGDLAGSVNVFQIEGSTDNFLGYWVARAFWGRGVATRAVRLIVTEVTTRPLVANVKAQNAASLAVLARNGFVEVKREVTPETERYLAGETVTMRLG